MKIQTIVALQIIADFIFCLVIVFLLARLRRSLDKERAPSVGPGLLLDLQKLINQSQSESERFLESLDASCRRFNQLALDLEIREKQMAQLLKEIDLKTEEFDARSPGRFISSGDRDYLHISDLLRRGLSVEEIAERTGVPSGEILLIAELEKLKKTDGD
jgi:hypothetical protein